MVQNISILWKISEAVKTYDTKYDGVRLKAKAELFKGRQKEKPLKEFTLASHIVI